MSVSQGQFKAVAAFVKDKALPSVAVIIPCYKYGLFLRQCVESVLVQSAVEVRVLVINDASPDNTAEVVAALLQEDPRVAAIHHRANIGHIDTYNEGIRWAEADYTLLLSADDYLLPGALERATSLMEANPDVGFTFGNVIELSEKGETHTAGKIGATRVLEGGEFIELSGAENLVTTCSAVVRTKLQKKLGGYRKDLPHAGDMEMWLRFAVHGPVGFISANQGVYRQHRANMSTEFYHISSGQVTYIKNGRLADLQQRRRALDCFSEHCRKFAPSEAQLCGRLYRHLSEIAVGRASAAFNEGALEASYQLSKFALEINPKVNHSSAWIRLAAKRWMGSRTWRAVKPIIASVRARPEET